MSWNLNSYKRMTTATHTVTKTTSDFSEIIPLTLVVKERETKANASLSDINKRIDELVRSLLTSGIFSKMQHEEIRSWHECYHQCEAPLDAAVAVNVLITDVIQKAIVIPHAKEQQAKLVAFEKEAQDITIILLPQNMTTEQFGEECELAGCYEEALLESNNKINEDAQKTVTDAYVTAQETYKKIIARHEDVMKLIDIHEKQRATSKEIHAALNLLDARVGSVTAQVLAVATGGKTSVQIMKDNT